MNVTRDVVTDLLPLYFSGDASEDTCRLVEDFFRENSDFERVARAAAKPLETLRNAARPPPKPKRKSAKCSASAGNYAREGYGSPWPCFTLCGHLFLWSAANSPPGWEGLIPGAAESRFGP